MALTFHNVDVTFGNVDLTFGNVDLTFGNVDQTFGNVDLMLGTVGLTFQNMDLTFGAIRRYWQHLGPTFTVVDPSYIRYKYRGHSENQISVVFFSCLAWVWVFGTPEFSEPLNRITNTSLADGGAKVFDQSKRSCFRSFCWKNCLYELDRE